MAQDDSGPLSVRNYTEINRALGLLNQYELECERAKRAGVDVGEHDMACSYYRRFFDQVKAEYFKNRP